MARLKENRAVINAITKTNVENKPSGTYEEMVLCTLGTIAVALCDISKSLAILADKEEREEEQNEDL
jgi:hypothetical protein